VNTSGFVVALLGVVLVAQVVKGGALQRLGILGCPAAPSTPAKPKPKDPKMLLN
jgi:hypothetical protein